MIRNFITIALRNLRKDKFYSALNLLGLTIGITCSLLLLLYITDELSYDKYHKKADQIYRVASFAQEPDKLNRWPFSEAPLAAALKADYPVVQNFVRLYPNGRVAFRQGEKRFYEEQVFVADSTMFDVFTHQFVEGDARTALARPGSVVLTRTVAEKFFGKRSALNQPLQVYDTTYQVTAVIEDVPKNSHLRFNALLSKGQGERQQDANWGNFGIATYIVLPKDYDPKKLESKFPQVYDKYLKPIFGRMNIKIDHQLQPLTSIHLHSKLEFESNGDIGYVYTFMAIAVFMLLIASINYMNLATARSAKRAKEVGLRKVMGSLRGPLMGQFLTESVLMTLLALVASFVLAAVLLPFFNDVSGKEIRFTELLQPQFLLLALVIVVFTGFVSGSYPAFYLSSFQPAAVLKGSFTSQGGNALFRKTLVVAQFAISLVMLICTWIVYDQLNYMRNKDLGYDKEQVLTIRFPGEQPRSSYSSLKNLLLANPQVRHVASANDPVSQMGGRIIFTVETNEGIKEIGFKPAVVDYDYVKTMGMKIVQGRDFSDKIPSDTALSVIVNETTVARMGWKQPLGKRIRPGGQPTDGGEAPPMAKVIGVVRDFHQQSLYNPIEALVILCRPVNQVIHVKVSPRNVAQTLAFIEQKWRQVYPDRLFEYTFLDQDFESAYENDKQRGRIFTAFALLTIVIACLGLFGLATFTTEQRVKEIGVRKVLGASVSSVVLLLSKDFTKLVLFSFPIAIPVAYFSMRKWLESFEYKTTLHPSIFVTACLLTLLICWVTVIYQSLKAALANPVKSLRSE
ncbi:MAG: Acidobacterial duplicated orphan permease (function unknown) [uncultured Cytophagales bacterium]|uniref:ABC transporter, permease protein n=1 Tax=uncultured Cytophagales bacterium TaxID=158755 RepID=A0A6J4JFX1_9SPHI|nr:MAG: Acidobacterial duplicated orphan permease (function unknown) [uncultured Cytophagales bacterium]